MRSLPTQFLAPFAFRAPPAQYEATMRKQSEKPEKITEKRLSRRYSFLVSGKVISKQTAGGQQRTVPHTSVRATHTHIHTESSQKDRKRPWAKRTVDRHIPQTETTDETRNSRRTFLSGSTAQAISNSLASGYSLCSSPPRVWNLKGGQN